MSQLINMEFYKVTRKKSIYVCFLLAVLSGFILSVSSGLFSESIKINASQWFLSAAADVSYFMFIFAIIIPAILFTSEFSENTMKNLLFNGVDRKKLFFSKIIVISATIAIINILIPLVGIIFMTIFKGWGGDFQVHDLMKLIFIILRMTLVMVAYGSIFTFVGLIFKNLIGSIAFSYSIRLVEGFLLLASNHFIQLSWLKKIILVGMDAYYLSPIIEKSTFIMGTILSLGIIIVVCFLSATVFERQDIRT